MLKIRLRLIKKQVSLNLIFILYFILNFSLRVAA
jgi:hypothetical protein